MTKEEKYELIELSDLNKEDNIKYISSEAQGIAITLDNDKYAPTLCKLERAYICGRRKSEEHIAKLEQEKYLLGERCNQLLKDKGDLTDANSRLLSQVAATTKRVIELEQQIEKAVEIIRELGSTVREGVTCHYLVDNGALHKATLFIKEIEK